MNTNRTDKTRRMTGIAILSATIIVLQILSNFVKFGPVTITLSLAPIIIGAAIYGTGAGAILGFVFSAVVVLTGILGWDGGFIMLLMGLSPFGLLVTCLGKGTAAGWLSGVCYKAIAKEKRACGSYLRRHSMPHREHRPICRRHDGVLCRHPHGHGRRSGSCDLYRVRTCGRELCC